MKMHRLYPALFCTLLCSVLCPDPASAQGRDIRIIEEQGRGVITLSAENKMSMDCEVTLDIESTGLDLSRPTPVTSRVPAGKTMPLITLTPLPGQAWKYRYNTQYTQIISPPQENALEESTAEIRPWDVPQNPTTSPAQTESPDPDKVTTDSRSQQVSEQKNPDHHLRSTDDETDRMPIEISAREANRQMKPATESPLPNSQIKKEPGITLYTTPNCVQCDQARTYLNSLGVIYQQVDLSIPSPKSKGMYEQLYEQGFGGIVQAPVIAHGFDMYFEVQDIRELIRTLVYQ